LAFRLNWKKLIKITFTIIAVIFAVSIGVNLAFYYQLHSTLSSDAAYLQIRNYYLLSGISTILLFFTALLGAVYVMAMGAKHALDKGIIKLHDQQELEPALDDDAP
jgi:hypothetical protein